MQANAEITVVLKLTRETKNTYRYDAADEDAPVGNIYIQKKAMPGSAAGVGASVEGQDPLKPHAGLNPAYAGHWSGQATSKEVEQCRENTIATADRCTSIPTTSRGAWSG